MIESIPIMFLRFPTLHLERYRVDDVTQDTREDCYVATLRIADADVHDSRPYYLVVENDRGIDRHAIHLRVAGTFTGAFSFYVYCWLFPNLIMRTSQILIYIYSFRILNIIHFIYLQNKCNLLGTLF